MTERTPPAQPPRPQPPGPDDEIRMLRARLEEAEALIAAIRRGEVDALVHADEQGEKVVPLQGADDVYRLTVETMIEGALAVRPDGLLLYCNERFAQLQQQPIKQLLGQTLSRVFALEDRARLEALLRDATFTVAHAKCHMERRDGTRVPVLLAVRRAPDELARDVRIVVVTDLTELERAETGREQLARIVETAHDAIIGETLNGVVTSWNEGAENLYGYRADEMIGRHINVLEPPELKGQVSELLARMAAGESIQQFETQRISKTGERLDVVLTLSPILNDAGIATGVSTIVQDIGERVRAERALQESERRMASLLANVQLAAVMLDTVGRVTYCNDYLLSLVDKSREEVIGVDWFETFIPAEVRADVREVHAALLAEQPEAFHHENKVLTRDGAERLMHWDNAVLRGTDGATIGIASLGTDITELRHTVAALETSEQRFRKLIENTSDAIVILGEHGTIRFISQAVATIAGYTPKKLVGTNFLEYIHPDEKDAALAEISELLSAPNGESLRVKHRYRHLDGRWLTAEVVSSNHLQTEGIRGIVVTLHDVTWREQAEEKLRLASVLIERSSSVLFRWRATEGWPVDYVSDNVRQWGYAPEKLLSGEPLFAELIHPDDIQRVGQEVADHIAAGDDSFTQEYRLLGGLGEVIWVHDSTAIERAPDGAPLFFQGVVTNINEVKRAAEQLSTSKQLLENILNTIPVRVFWKDKNLVYQGANSRFAQDAGLKTAEQLVGKTDGDMPWRDQVAQYQADDRAVMESGKGRLLIEEPQTTPAGDTITLLTSKVPLRDAAGQVSGVLGVYMDVTDQKRKEAHLKLFRALVDQADIGIEVIEPDSLRFLDANQTTCRALGFTHDELLNKTVFDIDPHLTQAMHEQVVVSLQKLGGASLETVHQRKDGSRYPVEVKIKRVLLDREYYIASIRDLTELKQHEVKLQRVNKALLTLSAGNSAMVHAKNEQEVVQLMCNAIVSKGGYRMAWVGFAEDAPDKPVTPVGWAGDGADYVQHAAITWGDDARGQGPAGRCIRSGEPQLTADIAHDPTMQPWHEQARKHGYGSVLTLPLKMTDATVFGALMIYADKTDAFDPDEQALLLEMSSDLAYGILSQRTRTAHESDLQTLARSLDATVESLAHTVELRDPYTAGHQRRVAEIAVGLAGELGLSPDRIKGLRLAASIHDIGKISIPAEILAKPSRLSPMEFELIKGHAEAGYELLQGIAFPWPIAEMIRQHHERLDGSGYPRGLKGDEILLEARIMAVADVLEAMASHRPYRAARGLPDALAEIERGRATAYDPDVADACLRLFREKGFQLDNEDWGAH